MPNHVIRSPLLRGRVGRTRAAIRAWAYSTHIEPRTTQAVAKPPRSLHGPGTQSPAPTITASTGSHEPASPNRRHRPLKEAHNTHATTHGTLRDHPTIRSKLNLGFDCDTTKGALWRFGEAAHLLISQRSVWKCNWGSNSLRMRNNQSGCVAQMCSHSNRTNSNM